MCFFFVWRNSLINYDFILYNYNLIFFYTIKKVILFFFLFSQLFFNQLPYVYICISLILMLFYIQIETKISYSNYYYKLYIEKSDCCILLCIYNLIFFLQSIVNLSYIKHSFPVNFKNGEDFICYNYILIIVRKICYFFYQLYFLEI